MALNSSCRLTGSGAEQAEWRSLPRGKDTSHFLALDECMRHILRCFGMPSVQVSHGLQLHSLWKIPAAAVS